MSCHLEQTDGAEMGQGEKLVEQTGAINKKDCLVIEENMGPNVLAMSQIAEITEW